jgi:hypothetical protein
MILANACGPCIGQWDRRDVKKGELIQSSPRIIETSLGVMMLTLQLTPSSPRQTWLLP